MNFKSFQFLVLILLTSIVGAASSWNAHADAVLVPTIVLTDDWVDQKQAIICGKPEETSAACQDALRNCEAGIDRIISSAHSVCSKQPSECKIIDVTTTHFTQTAYNLLVRTPIDNYVNSAEAAGIKNCNAQPPPAPVETAEEARKRQDAMNAELGIIPGAADAGAPPVANANNGEMAAPAANDNAQAPAPAAPRQESAGGCSLQASHDPFELSQAVLIVLAGLIAFGALKFRQSRRV